MSTPSGPSTPTTPRTTRRRRVAAATATAALAAAAAAGLWSRSARPVPGATLAARSLAVMPFVDMSADSANRYFVDGLSEEITTALGRIGGLRVAARTSAFALRDRALDVRRIGDTLGVDAVLEGSVRRAGRRLRVTAQLVDAHTGLALWADEYDREVADVITVQDEIARAIAGALELRLPPQDGPPRVRQPTNFAAYDLYLRALQLRNSMSADALQRATDLLDRAIELQPDFSPAYAAKASVLAPRVYFRQLPREQGCRGPCRDRPRVRARSGTRRGARRARARAALLRMGLGGGRAIAAPRGSARPNNPHAWQHLGNYLRAMGRPNEAAAARLRGSRSIRSTLACAYSLGQDYLVAGRLPRRSRRSSGECRWTRCTRLLSVLGGCPSVRERVPRPGA